MERKTKVDAEEGKLDLLITREFDLPLELLFKAFEDKDVIEEWMGTKVLELENKPHGGWKFQTSDQEGNVVFQAHGVIHEFSSNERIIRTFEMENAPYGVQLEFLEFSKLTDETSKLSMQIVYKSNAHRDEMLKLPFKQGVNMAHNQLQKVVSKLKNPI